MQIHPAFSPSEEPTEKHNFYVKLTFLLHIGEGHSWGRKTCDFNGRDGEERSVEGKMV